MAPCGTAVPWHKKWEVSFNHMFSIWLNDKRMYKYHNSYMHIYYDDINVYMIYIYMYIS